jgi:alkylation response protein AidB-like acyl-CoA dehydrogenase
MEIQHKQSTIDWQQKVRQFVDAELIPWEIEAEMNQGVISEAVRKNMQDKAIALGLSKMDAPSQHGGLNMSMVDQVAAWEELNKDKATKITMTAAAIAVMIAALQ